MATLMSDTSDPKQEHVPELTLGWRLKMALGDRSAQSIADDLGVTRGTVSRWMADRGAPPKAAYIKMWALITQTDVRWLLTGQQTVPHPGGPDGGLEGKCAVRESNPQPADLEHPAVTTWPDYIVGTGWAMVRRVPVEIQDREAS